MRESEYTANRLLAASARWDYALTKREALIHKQGNLIRKQRIKIDLLKCCAGILGMILFIIVVDNLELLF